MVQWKKKNAQMKLKILRAFPWPRQIVVSSLPARGSTQDPDPDLPHPAPWRQGRAPRPQSRGSDLVAALPPPKGCPYFRACGPQGQCLLKVPEHALLSIAQGQVAQPPGEPFPFSVCTNLIWLLGRVTVSTVTLRTHPFNFNPKETAQIWILLISEWWCYFQKSIKYGDFEALVGAHA